MLTEEINKSMKIMKKTYNYEHIQNESSKFYCTFIVINILAFKVK